MKKLDAIALGMMRVAAIRAGDSRIADRIWEGAAAEGVVPSLSPVRKTKRRRKKPPQKR